MNLMFCGNEKVIPGIIIALLSMCKYTKEQLTVYLLTMDLSEKGNLFNPITEEHRALIENKLKEKNKENRVFRIDATDMYKKEMHNGKNKNTHYTPYIFLRLLCDKIPELPNKLLYLDADIVCYGDIKPLYEIDMKNYEIAAARDFIGRKWIGKNYLNSGVLLINVQNVRESRCIRVM